MTQVTQQQWKKMTREKLWDIIDIGGDIKLPITAQVDAMLWASGYNTQFNLGNRPVLKMPEFTISFVHNE